MTALEPFKIILHVRVPEILRGRDQQRYLERKLNVFGLRLSPPPMLGTTGIPAGYGLVSCYTGGWNVVEARGEIDAGVTILTMMQHELVENVMNAAGEDRLRAVRAAQLVALPRLEAGLDDENITAGGPMPHRLLIFAVIVATYLCLPLTLFLRCIRAIRRWYVRDIS